MLLLISINIPICSFRGLTANFKCISQGFDQYFFIRGKFFLTSKDSLIQKLMICAIPTGLLLYQRP